MARRNQILIIDDDKAMCQLLEKLFEKEYNIITKNDGLSAMYWLVGGNIPDLIITDLDMPNLNGEEFIKNLRKSGYYKDIPFIIITSFNDKSGKVRIMKLGVHDYFVKPFNPKDLLFSTEVALKHNQKKISVL